MGFLRLFFLDAIDGDTVVVCQECSNTWPVTDVYNTVPMLPLIRMLEDHFYGMHVASS